jgi:hypothetical protein
MVGIFSVEDSVREIFLPKEVQATAQEIMAAADERIYQALGRFSYKERGAAKKRLTALLQTMKSSTDLLKINLTEDINYDKEILRFAHGLRSRSQYIIDASGWQQDCYRNASLFVGHPIIANPVAATARGAAAICKHLRLNNMHIYVTVHTRQQMDQLRDIVDGFILPEPYSALQ